MSGSTPKSSDDQEASSSLSTGVKVGIGIGVGVGVLIFLTAISLWCLTVKRNRHSGMAEDYHHVLDENKTGFKRNRDVDRGREVLHTVLW